MDCSALTHLPDLHKTFRSDVRRDLFCRHLKGVNQLHAELQNEHDSCA